MAEKHKTFYTNVNGKDTPYKFAKGEFEHYKAVCEMIWGGYPLDLDWAKGTKLYQEAEAKLLKDKQ